MKKILLGILGMLVLILIVACVPDDDGGSTKYTVAFNVHGGTPIASIEVDADSLLAAPTAPTRDGFDFAGWYKESTYATPWNFETDTVTANVTLHAKWDEIVPIETYTITFDSKGGSAVDPVDVASNEFLALPENPTREGFIFSGWYINENYANPWNFTKDYATANTTLYARWKETTNHNQTFKILSIGNSFSEDAHRYLWNIAASYGIAPENIVIGNMYIGGAELIQHYNNSNTNAATYQYQLFKGPNRTTTNNVTLGQAIGSEVWDVITFQQASHHSGLVDRYSDHLVQLTRWVDALALNPNVKIGWHMTWAYQQTSNHSGFANYNNSQATMYEMILETTQEKVMTVPQVQTLIPSGTAIQNARTSYVGDRLTHDGYHLTDPLGRYIAGLTFFKAITGFELSVETVEFRPAGVSETDQLMAMEAVNNAYNEPFEVTQSTYDEEPEPEPIEVNGVEFEYDLVHGYWNDNATAVTNTGSNFDLGFTAVMPIPKALLPVGSEIVVQPGYQYRVIFLNKVGDGWQVVHRTTNFQVSYVEIDAAFWGSYQYIAFNVSKVPNVVISDLDEIKENFRLYHPEGTGEGHLDTELTWSLGTWIVDGEALADTNFAFASNPLTPAYFGEDYIVSVADGYKFAYVVLTFDDGYLVLSVSDYQDEDLLLDEAFKEDKELIAFIVTADDEETDLSDAIFEEIVSITPSYVPHVNQPLTFVQGFWNTNATQILTEDTAFNKNFIASNVLSKAYFMGASNLTVEAGYQVRVIFLTYDGYGGYRVVHRTDNLLGTQAMSEAFWGEYEYIAFNLSAAPNRDISLEIAEVADKLSFDYQLTYVQGFWNTSATQILTEDTAFNKNFIASNVVSRALIPAGTVLTLEAGYQVRIIFLSYDEEAGFRVLHRTDNFTVEAILTSAMYGNYQFIAFNLSTLPSRDISLEIEAVAAKMTLSPFADAIIEHVDQPLTFTQGFWADNARQITVEDTSFNKTFIASNVLSKAHFEEIVSLAIEAGYQVRVIFLSYEFNQYMVHQRTANLTGTVVMDESFWGNYQYVAFNISSTTANTDISGQIEEVAGKLVFNTAE